MIILSALGNAKRPAQEGKVRADPEASNFLDTALTPGPRRHLGRCRNTGSGGAH